MLTISDEPQPNHVNNQRWKDLDVEGAWMGEWAEVGLDQTWDRRLEWILPLQDGIAHLWEEGSHHMGAIVHGQMLLAMLDQSLMISSYLCLHIISTETTVIATALVHYFYHIDSGHGLH